MSHRQCIPNFTLQLPGKLFQGPLHHFGPHGGCRRRRRRRSSTVSRALQKRMHPHHHQMSRKTDRQTDVRTYLPIHRPTVSSSPTCPTVAQNQTRESSTLTVPVQSLGQLPQSRLLSLSHSLTPLLFVANQPAGPRTHTQSKPSQAQPSPAQPSPARSEQSPFAGFR